MWCALFGQACLLPTSIFLTNKSGYPVLSRAHQKVVTTLYTVRPCSPRVVVERAAPSPSPLCCSRLLTASVVAITSLPPQRKCQFIITGRARAGRMRHYLDVRCCARPCYNVVLRPCRIAAALTWHPFPLHVRAQYVEHLFSTLPDVTEQEEFEGPYLDYLQMPLQPLADNLESQTCVASTPSRTR